jgi:hypothetical protein
LSAGDLDQHARKPSEIALAAAHATVARRLAQAYRLNRTHDLPYLAGYSTDGKTIYIDRHMPKTMRYRGRTIDTDKFLIIHERVEKSLIDECGWGYWPAHRHAEGLEEEAEDAAGVPHEAVQRFFKPYIKADAKEKLILVPKDLDMTPYLALPVDKDLVAHMRVRMGIKISKEAAHYGEGKPSHHCGICEYFRPMSDGCERVNGRITAEDGCRFFERKR